MSLVVDYKKTTEVFGKEHPFYSLIEVASNNDPEVVPEESERLLAFLETVSEHIIDGIVPQGES